jgi:hypothetical protein
VQSLARWSPVKNQRASLIPNLLEPFDCFGLAALVGNYVYERGGYLTQTAILSTGLRHVTFYGSGPGRVSCTIHHLNSVIQMPVSKPFKRLSARV